MDKWGPSGLAIVLAAVLTLLCCAVVAAALVRAFVWLWP